MDNLILTMIVAHDNYGDDIGYTSSDIENIIKKYDYINKIRCNELGWIILWKHKYIDDEKFSKLMGVKFIDGSFYLVEKNFDDILDSKKYESEIKILDGEYDDYNYSFYDIDIDYDDYNEDTLNAIIEYCDSNGLDIDDELITKENTKIVDSEIFFNDEKLLDFIDEDSLDDLKNQLCWGAIEAQESADMDEIYQKLKNSFTEKVGEYEWKNDKLYVKLDNISMNDVYDFLIESYGQYEFEEENYGSLFYILKEMEVFDIDTPDYNYIYGTIDKEILNDYTQNRLSI